MKIDLTEKEFDVLLQNVAIWEWVYGIMSDGVDSKYKKNVLETDELIDKLLKYSNDDKIKETFDWKEVFSEEYCDGIAEEMRKYEDYVVEDLTGINMEELKRDVDEEMKKFED